jgi:hypothetical protein
MTESVHERAAVLVIRVWTEPGSASDGLRARITRMLDLSGNERIETLAASREEIAATVEDWLDKFLAEPT